MWSSRYKPGITGVVVGVSDANIQEIKANLETLQTSDVFCLPADVREDMYLKSSPGYIKSRFVLLLNPVYYCNLNCKGCRNFSPLAKPGSISDFATIQRDILRLKEIGIDYFWRIFISGGEPTLHPDIFKILELCRVEYPKAVVELVTNGILLKTYTDEKWEILRKLDITISMSNYPSLGSTFKDVLKKIDEHGLDKIRLDHELNKKYDNKNRQFVKWHFNMEKTAPPYTFFNCKRFIGRTSIALDNGKLFPCRTMVHSKHFANYFDKNLEILPDDCLDIYDSHITAEDIFRYAIKRYPFCGYCDMEKNALFPWGVSEKKIEEWT
jgi:sulfatase maturation enzyme AslB (radical SAM superfamily)